MILEVRDLKFAYGGNQRTIYDDFSITVESSERVGLIAPSGFGKTTLCKLIAGYEKPAAGEILLDGRPINSYKGYCPVQMIWQHPETVINPRRKMKHVLMEGDFGIKSESELISAFEDGNETDLGRIVKGLGIRKEWLSRYPQELSGGEQQRFCIARTLGQGTKFLLADEISTMLDLITQKEIWDFLLKEIEMRGIGLITVSHSPALLERVCTRIINLEK